MKSNLEILLGEWGAWKRGENRSALGYPDEASFVKMRVDGLRRVEPDALMVDDTLRRLDEAIEHGLHSELRGILLAHYVWLGQVKTKLDRLGISRSLYFFRLDYATKQLSHQMGMAHPVGIHTHRLSAGATI